MRRAAKVDDNQAEIVALLRTHGASVAVMSAVGQGFPDLVVGYRGRNYLIEVKMPKGKMTEEQYDFAGHWRGQYAVVRSFDEAAMLLQMPVPRMKILDDE